MSMDQNLKQRLIGALVITALAAIFVPMVFDDPVAGRGQMISNLTVPAELPAARDYMANPAEIKKVNLPETSYLQPDVSIETPEQAIQNSVAEERVVEQTAVADVNMDRWFVQVGIFSEEANAISIRDKIRKQGFPVMVSAISGVKGKLHRVMVGPELSKDRAKEIKHKMDIINGFKGILISNAKI